MISFLTCNANAVLKLILNISYQEKDKIKSKSIEVDTDTIYKITVADNMLGLNTYNGRIISFTMNTEDTPLNFVNSNTKPIVVDTIKLDCSDEQSSKIVYINVSDIRYIEEMSTSGFDEIVNREIDTFR